MKTIHFVSDGCPEAGHLQGSLDSPSGPSLVPLWDLSGALLVVSLELLWGQLGSFLSGASLGPFFDFCKTSLGPL